MKEADYCSSIGELEEKKPEGDIVAVGFRPSGELHIGNLLTLAYSAVVADRFGKDLEITCCDTDWSAHIPENHMPDNSDVMKLFHQRDCPCSEHDNIGEHRIDELKPFIEGLKAETGVDVRTQFMSEIETREYNDALRHILENINEFDEIFGGGFRRRYRSPVVNVCECGFSHAKGAVYSSETDELVFACWNPECPEGFASSSFDELKGVYYLVDPVRDPSRDTAVHVFGGDYRDAMKGQKTSKLTKVSRITEMAAGETPEYFLSPLIADAEGRPLSKSKNAGKSTSDIDDLEEYGRELFQKADGWIETSQEFVSTESL